MSKNETAGAPARRKDCSYGGIGQMREISSNEGIPPIGAQSAIWGQMVVGPRKLIWPGGPRAFSFGSLAAKNARFSGLAGGVVLGESRRQNARPGGSERCRYLGAQFATTPSARYYALCVGPGGCTSTDRHHFSSGPGGNRSARHRKSTGRRL